ncbi:hypothetical protein SGFS_002670 [Streptomyces graminofaciens]|uniref:Peptidase inhibitor family I36 n=1 Tax=Streptomyces graminofaciens TaxID=68212 RepID=A0ABM7F053_9ACTN|nr:hypothetical protein [Streptomyces graminofaciens]BBC28976.1 hypothetical protein SGFS_002670 [Streptomyces graminofaciens]
MKRKLSVLLAAGAAVTGIMAMPGTASAAGGCKTMSAPGGGSAYVCKYYYDTDGDGYYNGDFSVSDASSRVYTQYYADGGPYSLTPRGGGVVNSFRGKKSFHIRVCNTSCSSYY